MPRNALALIGLLSLVACGPDYGGLRDVQSTLIHTERPVDFGQLAVGATEVEGLKLDVSKQSPIEILELQITGEGADQFAVLTDAPLDVLNDGGAWVDLAFAPTEPGWHSTTLSLVYRGDDGRHEDAIPLRGQAVLPEILVLPWRIDFGPVPAGSTDFDAVVVRNIGDLDLTLAGASLSNPAFAAPDAAGLTVRAGLEQVLQVSYTAADDLAASATLTLLVADVSLDPVVLVANDCAQGDPAAWDQDGDGFTACAVPLRDCDDGNIDANPAATEAWDGVDNDCDGVIDEGTRGFDDDGDGFCEGPGACSDGALPGDCSDANSAVAPDQAEVDANGIDDNCDGIVDTGTVDFDGDGVAPDGGDCDDTRADVGPGAPEVGDWRDNDCDGIIDEDTPLRDDDGDGFCDDPTTCSDGSSPGDCSDIDVGTFPTATEAEDWKDNNCNGLVDENTRHDDTDMDGFSELGGDCDDADPAESPALTGNICP